MGCNGQADSERTKSDSAAWGELYLYFIHNYYHASKLQLPVIQLFGTVFANTSISLTLDPTDLATVHATTWVDVAWQNDAGNLTQLL